MVADNLVTPPASYEQFRVLTRSEAGRGRWDHSATQKDFVLEVAHVAASAAAKAMLLERNLDGSMGTFDVDPVKLGLSLDLLDMLLAADRCLMFVAEAHERDDLFGRRWDKTFDEGLSRLLSRSGILGEDVEGSIKVGSLRLVGASGDLAFSVIPSLAYTRTYADFEAAIDTLLDAAIECAFNHHINLSDLIRARLPA